MKFTLAEIAEKIGARLQGEADARIDRLASVEQAGPGALCFAESARYAEQVAQGAAGAIVVGEDFPELPGCNLLRAAEPRLAFLKAMELFVPPLSDTGIDPRAWVAEDARLAERVSIGPGAVIAAGARVGTGTRIDSGAYIGPGVSIGADCHIKPNASVLDQVVLGDRCIVHAGAVIGGDGYGYRWLGDHHHKIPQLGRVVVEDDVEIGCNAAIDRATLGVTRIGRGTKIDNLVHIAHNVEIGEHVLLTAQVAIAGSSSVGPGSVFAGQSAVSDHVRVGAQVQVGGQAGVTRDVADKAVVFGTPARAFKRVMREQAALGKLPELLKQVREQQDLIEDLRARLERLEKS